MRKLLVLLFFCPFVLLAQTVTTIPSVPSPNQPVTIRVNVTGTSLAGHAWNNVTDPVYIWAWLEKGAADVDAPTNVNPATSPAQDAAKCTRISTNPDVYEITFIPTTFFNRPAAEITQVGLKLKTKNWNENKQTDNDRYITFTLNFGVTFLKPLQSSFFVNSGETIDIQVSTNENAVITIKSGDNAENFITSSNTQVTNFSYPYLASELSGSTKITCIANNGTEEKSISFTYTIRSATQSQSRPSGVIDGINYQADPTKVTLSLLAPNKSSVYVVGDFNNWSISDQYKMKKDGEHFWLEIANLTAGEQYAFKYLVDETIWLADPYSDLILDPDDKFIPTSIYPSIKPFPEKALRSEWYFNRASVLQTNQQPYQWQVINFEKPAKEKLIVYELLVRDFFDDTERSYTNLIDTLSYLKRLGVNAIQLMPIMEFGGNESWGYNPQFMFAPDKAYGPKNTLKQFIDVCHQHGIAVIFDIAMNHQDMPNPYLLMDFNYTTFKPNPSNKWFNVEATHPFNVFYDMNHESAYTKQYLDTVNYYWLNEYKIDGYRFDLSKGFTQTNSGSNVGAWSARDNSRIALLKRMADKIWSHSPDAYVILEHFADNSEEKELAQYRADQGKGMLFWGNLNHAYSQNSMSFSDGSDISWIYHGSRTWSVPHVIGYMESHDEERMMYRNLQFGRSSTSHNIKTVPVALERIKAASTMFYTIPGPKMLWQFGELGYDISIDEGGRVSPKPVKWEYRDDPARYKLYEHVSDLIRLHKEHEIFNIGTPTFYGGNELVKQVVLKNSPYTTTPISSDQMNAVVVANFDIVPQIVYVEFPHTGAWYDYYRYGAILPVDIFPFPIEIPPGGYKIYTDVEITNSIVVGGLEDNVSRTQFSFYPNPTSDFITVTNQYEIIEMKFYTLQGVPVEVSRINSNTWDLRKLQKGVFISEAKTAKGYFSIKVIKN